MLMPALLPEQLQYCQKAESQRALFDLLKKFPPDLILFLEAGCSDETWAEDHAEFISLGIEWVHTQFFQDNLMMEFAQQLTKVLRKHTSIARMHVPLNVTLKLKDRELPISTLMYGSCSLFWKELIRLECRDRNSNVISLTEISYDVFTPIDEFITKGSVEGIHVKTKETVESILALSLIWNLPELGDACQRSLKKWINRDNMIETLIETHRNGWSILRAECMNYMNDLNLDFCFHDSKPEQLLFEFLRFTETSVDFFRRLNWLVTHLIFSGNTTADPTFSKLVNECPTLRGLDLSYSHLYTDYLQNIPSHLEELNLSSCNWINNETLSSMVEYCPQLKKLVIASDVNLNFEAWSVLGKLTQLKTLDINRCSQIEDDDLKLILQSCESLQSLSLEECRGITDEGFYHISIYNKNLVNLNLARTDLSDLPLIDIANKCVRLLTLDLTRCEKISEKGLLEAVRAAKALKELSIINCKIPEAAILNLKRIRPFLKVLL